MKSRAARNTEIDREKTTTTMVSFMVSEAPGQLTRFISRKDSVKNDFILVTIEIIL